MKLLLDTCAFLWWMGAPDKLSPNAAEAICSPDSLLHLSAASAWEISVKRQLGRLDLPKPTNDFLIEACSTHAVTLLGISVMEAVAAGELPLHHKDPFDRMLIAQTLTEPGMRLVSPDKEFAAYGVDLLW